MDLPEPSSNTTEISQRRPIKRVRNLAGHWRQRIPADLRQPIENHTGFCLELAKLVSLQSLGEGTNLVFSPLSIHVALCLVAAGSKGQTQQQFCSVLRYQSSEDLNSLSSRLISLILADASSNGGPRLNFVNGIWVEKSLPLKPTFKEIANTHYKAEAKSVDFINKSVEVSEEVNSWVGKETNGLIKELLPSGSIDALTRLVIANALYFKGTWNEKFDASETRDGDFYLLDGSSVMVPFMTSKKDQHVRSFDGFKVLKLPYVYGEDKRDFSMYFFLPDAMDGLQNLVEKLASNPGLLDCRFLGEKVKVGKFKIPRFKISFGFEAIETLKKLGLVLPFSSEGDLSEMAKSGRLYVSNIFHKSFVEVNEEGTEAAAATAIGIRKCCAQISAPIDFVADHPFVFVIREDLTGVVLFIGHVFNPMLST